MQKIVFLQSLSKQYLNFQEKVKKNYQLLDSIKLLVTFLIFFLTLGVYGYVVNISSTKGYFLREERQQLENIKFSHSITQLEVLKMEKKLWDNIESEVVFDTKSDKIEDKIINLKYNKEVSLNTD